MPIVKWPTTWYQYTVDHMTTWSSNPHAVDSAVLAFFICVLAGPPTLVVGVLCSILLDARWSGIMMTAFGVLWLVGAVCVWVTKNLTTFTLEYYIGPLQLIPQTPLSKAGQAVFTWACCTSPGLLNLVFIKIGQVMVADSNRKLEDSKCQTEQLNGQLIQQQQQLEVQQSLTCSLISNVFPESVYHALIDLFQQSSKTVQDSFRSIIANTADLPAGSALHKYRQNPATPLMIREAGESHHTLPACALISDGGAAFPGDVAACTHPNAVQHSASTDTQSVRSASSVDTSTCSGVASTTPSTAEMMQRIGHTLAPRLHHAATVLFADIVGFTGMASVTAPTTLVQFLDALFGRIDEVCLAPVLQIVCPPTVVITVSMCIPTFKSVCLVCIPTVIRVSMRHTPSFCHFCRPGRLLSRT